MDVFSPIICHAYRGIDKCTFYGNLRNNVQEKRSQFIKRFRLQIVIIIAIWFPYMPENESNPIWLSLQSGQTWKQLLQHRRGSHETYIFC